MQLKAMRVGRVQLYTTGLDAEEQRLTGVETIASVDAAVAREHRSRGRRRRRGDPRRPVCRTARAKRPGLIGRGVAEVALGLTARAATSGR